jgi:hypothetical protein
VSACRATRAATPAAPADVADSGTLRDSAAAIDDNAAREAPPSKHADPAGGCGVAPAPRGAGALRRVALCGMAARYAPAGFEGAAREPAITCGRVIALRRRSSTERQPRARGRVTHPLDPRGVAAVVRIDTRSVSRETRPPSKVF